MRQHNPGYNTDYVLFQISRPGSAPTGKEDLNQPLLSTRIVSSATFLTGLQKNHAETRVRNPFMFMTLL